MQTLKQCFQYFIIPKVWIPSQSYLRSDVCVCLQMTTSSIISPEGTSMPPSKYLPTDCSSLARLAHPRIKVMVLSSPPPRSLGRFPLYCCAPSQCHNLDETPENIIAALDDDDNMLDNNNRTTKGRAPPKLWGWPASRSKGKAPKQTSLYFISNYNHPFKHALGLDEDI